MMRAFLVSGCLAAMLSAGVDADEGGVADVQIQPAYRQALLANEFLMQGGGVDVVAIPDQGEVLVGVGQAALASASNPPSRETLRARTVAGAKAKATVSRFLRSEVSTVSTLVKETTVIAEHVTGEEDRRSCRIEKYLKTRIDERSHLAARIEEVGRWYSADRDFIYIAVAVMPLD